MNTIIADRPIAGRLQKLLWLGVLANGAFPAPARADPPPWDAARGREQATTLYPAKHSPRDFKWNEKAVRELSRKAPLRITVKRAGATEVITGRNLELTHISEKVARKGGVLALSGGVIVDVRWVVKHGRPGGRAYKVRRFEGEWISVQWQKAPRAGRQAR